MPPTAAAPAVLDGTVLRQRLAALRRRLRRTAILRGASWLVLATAATAVAACLVDSLWPLDSLVRAAVLVAWLVGVGLLSWRFLFRPLSQRTDDLSLALRVEQRFPALNDALASTVQFLDAPAGAGGDSASLRREAVKRTLARAKGYDFNRVVDGRGLRSTAAGAVLAGAAAVTLLLLYPVPAFSAWAGCSTRSSTARCRRKPNWCWSRTRRPTASARGRPTRSTAASRASCRRTPGSRSPSGWTAIRRGSFRPT